MDSKMKYGPVKAAAGLFIAAIMVLMFVFMIGTRPAYAATVVDSGTAGTNVNWTLDSDGVLRFTGTGVITCPEGTRPWDSTAVKSIVIESGIT